MQNALFHPSISIVDHDEPGRLYTFNHSYVSAGVKNVTVEVRNIDGDFAGQPNTQTVSVTFQVLSPLESNWYLNIVSGLTNGILLSPPGMLFVQCSVSHMALKNHAKRLGFLKPSLLQHLPSMHDFAGAVKFGLNCSSCTVLPTAAVAKWDFGDGETSNQSVDSIHLLTSRVFTPTTGTTRSLYTIGVNISNPISYVETTLKVNGVAAQVNRSISQFSSCMMRGSES